MSSEREAVWQRVIQVPTRSLFKRFMKVTGCEKARATQVLQEYKRFLVLKVRGQQFALRSLPTDNSRAQVIEADYDGTRLAASPSLRAIWQQHVLDTAAYAEHCSALCGGLLHHSPDAHDDQRFARRAHRALALYRRHFGEDPPTATWDFGDIGLPPRLDEDAEDEPAAKRARAAAGSATLHVGVQAPALSLTQITARGGDSVHQLFTTFVAAAGASHLLVGRTAMPPTTRLRCNGQWLSNDAQTLADAGVEEGSVVYVATPRERASREELLLYVKEVGGQKETATLFLQPHDDVRVMMRQVQDTLGVASDAQQLIFSSKVLRPSDTLASAKIGEGNTVQLVVGRRPTKAQQMSPGGTWS